MRIVEHEIKRYVVENIFVTPGNYTQIINIDDWTMDIKQRNISNKRTTEIMDTIIFDIYVSLGNISKRDKQIFYVFTLYRM